MFPIKEFEKRFREILLTLDEIGADAQDESMDELNATFEDALFVIECIGENDEDWREAFEDALDEFDDLCAEYDRFAALIPELTEQAARLRMLVTMARSNLE